MTETQTAVVTPEDRTLPAVVYGLYLLGLVNGLTILVGLVIAYMNRDTAGPRMRTHYTFLIRTFWISIAWFVIAGLLVLFGGVLSLVNSRGALISSGICSSSRSMPRWSFGSAAISRRRSNSATAT